MDYEGTAGKIDNDALVDDDFIPFLAKAFGNADSVMKPGAPFYLWHSDSRRWCFLSACNKIGWQVREILVWVKNSLILGRQDYQWRHEPCIYGWKDGAKHYFIDLRSLTTIEDKAIDQMSREEAIAELKQMVEFSTIQYENKPTKNPDHPTMKPLPLIKRHIRNSSRENESVLDIFGGSGTTLIACEEMNRICYMMEYDEHYADVIITRWEKLTGKKAEKVECTEKVTK